MTPKLNHLSENTKINHYDETQNICNLSLKFSSKFIKKNITYVDNLEALNPLAF